MKSLGELEFRGDGGKRAMRSRCRGIYTRGQDDLHGHPKVSEHRRERSFMLKMLALPISVLVPVSFHGEVALFSP